MGKKRRHVSQNIHTSDFVVRNNCIFYNRLFNTDAPQYPLWKEIGKTAKSELDRNIEFFNQASVKNEVGDFLLAQAAAERKKEINFMEKVFGIDTTQLDPNDYPALITKLNDLIGLKDNYQYLVKALNEGVGKTEAQKKKRRGYGAAAYFDNYLAKQLQLKMSAAIKSQENRDIIISGDDAAYDDFITKIIEGSIEATIKHIAQVESDTIGGIDVHMWEKIIKILNETEEVLYGRFKSELYTRFNLDNVKKEMRTFVTDKLKNKKTLWGIQKKIKDSYQLSEKAMRGAEGFLEEFLQAVMPNNSTITEKGTVVTRRGTVLESNVAKTDTVSLYSADVNFNLQPLLDEINSAGHFHNLVETQDFLNDFNNKLQSMPDNFVVYESVKKYATKSDNFRGFHGGTVNIKNLKTMFQKTQNPIDVDKLIITLLNTMNGAVLTNGKEERKKISHALSSSVATFLFDDWESVGDINNDHALHIFILDAVRVPLSYLLYAVGTAIKQAESNPGSFVKLSYNLGSILYPDPIGSKESGVAFDPAGGIKKYWDEQRKKAFDEANFSATFLQNFNELIKDLVQKLPKK